MQTLENNDLILFYAYTLLDNLKETRDRKEIYNFIERKRKEQELEILYRTCATTTDHGENAATGTSTEQETKENPT